MKPAARTNDLEIKEITGELYIHDLKHEKAICLNPTSAYVWRKCNGEKEIDEIAAEMQAELGVPVSEKLVFHTINRLLAEHLLENKRRFV